MAQVNLLDIAKLNGNDAVVGLVEEAFAQNAAPELQRFPSRTIKGTTYQTVIRTGLPTAAFRNANEGTALSKSTFANKIVQTFIIDEPIRADKAVADAYEDGADAWKALEALGTMVATMAMLGKQIWYGNATNATGITGSTKGFPGAMQLYNSTDMEVDATGTTATTGSSVWGVIFGPQHCQLVYGQNGTLSMGEWYLQQVNDASSNPYTAYCSALGCYPGMQSLNKYSLGRIRDITEDSGKTLTDALLNSLMQKFESKAGRRPDALFMSPRSRYQLAASRTPYNPQGDPVPAPTQWEGIPIITTNQILNTEALV